MTMFHTKQTIEHRWTRGCWTQPPSPLIPSFSPSPSLSLTLPLSFPARPSSLPPTILLISRRKRNIIRNQWNSIVLQGILTLQSTLKPASIRSQFAPNGQLCKRNPSCFWSHWLANPIPPTLSWTPSTCKVVCLFLVATYQVACSAVSCEMKIAFLILDSWLSPEYAAIFFFVRGYRFVIFLHFPFRGKAHPSVELTLPLPICPACFQLSLRCLDYVLFQSLHKHISKSSTGIPRID